MKILNIVRSKTLLSDTVTDDPILYSGRLHEKEIPKDFFLYIIKLGDKHCTGSSYGDAFNLDNGVLHDIPNDVLSRVTEGTAKIVISWPLESFVDDSIFLQMHNYFNAHNIFLSSVIYLNCCANGKIMYESFCNRHNIGTQRISIEYIPWYMYDRTSKSSPYVPGKRSRTFFALNRRMHEHRCLMLMILHKENLLDKFYISFPKHHVGTNETFFNKAARMHLMQQYNISQEDVKSIDNKLPMVLDITDWNPYPLPIVSNKLSFFYQNSFISIVAETFFYSNVIHLTEKTFKPIVNRHPFIVVSAPYTLKAIRSFGFKTFDTIIDESYDNILDHNKRFDTIIDIIKDMSLWDKKKIAKTTAQIKDIVDYNYDLLIHRPTDELNSFVEKYGILK
jgi:hypothetical protein